MKDYTAWLGKQRSRESLMDPWPVGALHASLGLAGESPDSELPPLWHWLYFLETPRRDGLGRDGHPRTGDFFPAIAQPRRMFVGGRSRLLEALRMGVPAKLVETIRRCEAKRGSAGDMTLLTVGYELFQGGRRCVEEERDFMYLPERGAVTPEPRHGSESPLPEAPLSLDVVTDPVLLFKFSALTFNGHRIHYDADYAREVEGYPDIVVHGPLTALLLARLAAGPDGKLTGFDFRARAPLFCGDRLRLRGSTEGDKVLVNAYRPDGEIAMTAEARR